eukprot:TRINITY_DN66361_c0_g1_i1.p1 TRINITY_DN66361_c0_g1~~TRINITY_DN66361_c0_g1_i1.p1  ORF type:complete len:108 (+),score=4.66 TRINITY_DN66361_c0_g1_i1:3-326(+)
MIDRCNIHPKERKMWMNDAKRLFGISNYLLVWLDTPIDECKRRVRERTKHPTLAGADGDAVIDDFAKGFKPPQQFEGPYEKMWQVKPGEEKPVISELGDYPISLKDK